MTANLMGRFHTVQFAATLRGHLTFCGLVAGYIGLPQSQIYSAAKARVINLAQSSRAVLVGSVDVRPAALCAGWFSAASGVAIGVLLGGYGVLSFQNSAALCIIAVFVMALSARSRPPREWGHSAVIIWAFTGVIAAIQTDPNRVVIPLAAIGIARFAVNAIRPFPKGARK